MTRRWRGSVRENATSVKGNDADRRAIHLTQRIACHKHARRTHKADRHNVTHTYFPHTYTYTQIHTHRHTQTQTHTHTHTHTSTSPDCESKRPSRSWPSQTTLCAPSPMIRWRTTAFRSTQSPSKSAASACGVESCAYPGLIPETDPENPDPLFAGVDRYTLPTVDLELARSKPKIRSQVHVFTVYTQQQAVGLGSDKSVPHDSDTGSVYGVNT